MKLQQVITFLSMNITKEGANNLASKKQVWIWILNYKTIIFLPRTPFKEEYQAINWPAEFTKLSARKTKTINAQYARLKQLLTH